jgi:ribosomal protein L11 methyltransferase
LPTWLEIAIEVAPEAVEVMAATAADLVHGVEVRDAETIIPAAPNRAMVIAHLDPGGHDRLLLAVEEAAARLRVAGVPVDPIVVRERTADEDEWRDVWKQFFRATRVGATFLVRPSWDPGTEAPGDRVIDLDPGRAFGTGGHASTRLVIALCEEVAARPTARVRRFLDLGCGSGILSIAAARLWPEAIGLGVDVDPEATACARENLERNGVITVQLSTGSLDVVPVAPPYDLLLANIQADVLVTAAAALRARAAERATVILSGLLEADVDTVVAAYRAAGLDLVGRRNEGEWTALELASAP